MTSITGLSGISASSINSASSAPAGSVQEGAAIAVLKKSMQAQENAALTLIQALPQPKLATSGGVGTQVNTYA
jgi:Putative motility protein